MGSRDITPIMENRMDKKIEDDMETRLYTRMEQLIATSWCHATATDPIF